MFSWLFPRFWATQQPQFFDYSPLEPHFEDAVDHSVYDDWGIQHSSLVNEENSDSEDTVEDQYVAIEAGLRVDVEKKRRRGEILAAAREAKKRIKIADGDLRNQFFEDKVAPAESADGDENEINDAILKRKSFVYRVAMERLDEGYPWIYKHVSACAAISKKTLGSYYAVWKKLAESNPSNRVQILSTTLNTRSEGGKWPIRWRCGI